MNTLLEGFSLSAYVYELLAETLVELEPSSSHSTLLRKHGRDERVSLLRAFSLWNKLEKAYGKSDLGIFLAKKLTPERAGLVGQLFLQSPNLQTSCEMVARYLSIATDNVVLKFQPGENEVAIRFSVFPEALLPDSVSEFYLFTCGFWAMRYLSVNQMPVREASFRYAQPEHLEQYRAISPNAKVEFRQAENCLKLDSQPFLKPNPNFAPYLQELITEYADSVLAQHRSRRPISHQVMIYIQSALPNHAPTLEAAALELEINARNLRQKLADEGTSFRDLTELAKSELATVMMQDQRLLVEDIAYLLGYQEYSSFSRAFRKWHGQCPAKYRAGLGDMRAVKAK